MKKITLVLVLIGSGLFAAEHAPLPQKIKTARTVFLSVQTDVADTHLDALYSEIKKWGRWEIVDDPAKADLILLMSMQDAGQGSIATGFGNYATGSVVAVPILLHNYYLHVIDAKSNSILWTASTNQRVMRSHEPKRLVKKLRERLE